MATIPTLIVGPAIVAAGLAYRYGRFDDNSGAGVGQQKDGTGFSGLHIRRMPEMTSSTPASNGSASARSMGTRFEGDFQPLVPSERQRTDAFVPTNMLASSSLFSNAGDGAATAQQQGLSKASADSGSQASHRGHQEQQTERKQNIYDRISDRRVADTLKERENPYPRTTGELENRSWLFRAMHKVSGDLGPIEHKDSAVEKQRLVFQPDAESEQISSTQGANVLKGTTLFSNVAPDNNDQLKQSEEWAHASGLDAPGSRSKIELPPSSNVVGSTVHQASRAADDVNRLGVDDVDANQAALDVTGMGRSSDSSSSSPSSSSKDNGSSSSGGSGGWFWGSSDKSSADAAKKAASESRGWFWNKKQDAEKAASDAVASAEDKLQSASDYAQETADDARGWFGNKKQNADRAVTDTVGSVENKLQSASDSVNQAADDTRGWFQNKKQDADKATSDAVDSAEDKLQSTSDLVKETANDTRGWFWNKKQDIDNTISDTIDSAKDSLQSASDSLKESAESTRGWFWNKKQDADNTVSETVDSAKNKANEASSAVHDTVDSAKDSVNSAAAGSRDWLYNKKEGAKGALENEWEWVTGKVDDMDRSTRDAASKASDASQAWMWDRKSQADNAVANAAGTVRDQAVSARDRAAQRSAENRESAAGYTGAAATAGAMDSALSGDIPQERSSRRDSSMTPLKGSDSNSVLDALDSKFDEARTALRNTSEELRSMANDAGSAASEKIRDAAETVRFHPTNEGIVRQDIVRGRGENGEDIAMRFVEVDSGIPQLSNAGRPTTTAAPVRRNH
ncbi:hypothetical protein IW140_006260 [Coemansia sp. RSA 1813]|nr:hypothetical protein EV178_006176 [Coemansia sp. RSA 1646]KAJ1765752.1 hypothetical protein LPJ74_006219 [Coemansia sp. RSA 1843]KAJ2211889.1 hypothetical protein EV179_005124 [Coemansia sp. RSA 487]KAJ2562957.1 hypothetical protein IW140_006260 [Coemansia sp. RSA 1813]